MDHNSFSFTPSSKKVALIEKLELISLSLNSISKIELDFTISYGFHRVPMFLSTLQFVYFFFFYFNFVVNSILIRYDGKDEDYIIYIFFFIVHNSKGQNAIYSQS